MSELDLDLDLDLSVLSREDRERFFILLSERQRRAAGRLIYTMYPDEGPLSWKNYPQHYKFFELGATYKTRGFMAGNRVGKTEGGGGYEITCHLTGIYPSWWPGHKFSRPTEWWAAGDTKETVRDILQRKLLGPPEAIGTGLIPLNNIGQIKYKQSGSGAVDYVKIKHSTGGWSTLAFKSYEQGRISFQGTEKDGIWLDEEPDEGIRAECVMRLMTTKGLLIETFTPLKGLTPVVMKYLPEGYNDERVVVVEDRALVMAGWNDAPHLPEEDKRRILAECEPHLVEARTMGIPHIGSGAIYPVEETKLFIDDFTLPEAWPRAYSMDVGWNRTAALWGAYDKQSDTWYLYSEHYEGQAPPSIHADAIRARGKDLAGVIDPAARGRTQDDGEQLIQKYRDQGLNLVEADNAVEAGIYEVWQRMVSGRIKIFRSLRNTRNEWRVYQRDEKGKIKKEHDHLMDCMRYLIMSGLNVALNSAANNDFLKRAKSMARKRCA